jgi:HEAT repeat protein
MLRSGRGGTFAPHGLLFVLALAAVTLGCREQRPTAAEQLGAIARQPEAASAAAIRALLAAALGDADLAVRRGTADALLRVEGEEFLDLFRRALDDADSRVRLQAVRAIGRWGDATDVAALERAAERAADPRAGGDEETAARAAAGTSVLLRPDADATRARQAVADLTSDDRTTRLYAATTLGAADWQPSVAPLQTAARTDADELVRQIAVCALASFGASAVAPLLGEIQAMLAQDGFGRRCAVKALAATGDAAHVEQLAIGFESKDLITRRETVKAIVRLGATATQVEALVRAARNDPDESVRWEAVKALAGVERPEAAAVLVQALADPASRVRGAAAYGLARRGDVDHTRAALADAAWETKVSALVGLARRARAGQGDV